MTDPEVNEDDVTAMRQALKDSQGPGQFPQPVPAFAEREEGRHSADPGGRGRRQDEFFNIKNVTRDDVLAGTACRPRSWASCRQHRADSAPPIPATQVFATNEIAPLQARFQELNGWTGEEVVRFEPYEVAVTDAEVGGAEG